MDRPRLPVDFNEMPEQDLVLLSRSDTKRDSSGALVTLTEGLPVSIYEEDLDEAGRPDPLVAEGVVERLAGGPGWAREVPWGCRIGPRGVRHLSEDA